MNPELAVNNRKQSISLFFTPNQTKWFNTLQKTMTLKKSIALFFANNIHKTYELSQGTMKMNMLESRCHWLTAMHPVSANTV